VTQSDASALPSPKGSALIKLGIGLGLLALISVGAVLSLPWLEDTMAKQIVIEIERVSVEPEGGFTALLGGIPKSLLVSIDVSVTNENVVDIDLHEFEVSAYVNKTKLAHGSPDLPKRPLSLPSGETTPITLTMTVPTAAIAAVPFDVIRRGDIKVRVTGKATGEALGRRVTRDFEIKGISLDLKTSLDLKKFGL
jgi:hypothetical protein